MTDINKSTIARIVAQLFTNKNQLKTSFFFKKDENDRNNVFKFFITFVVNLMIHISELKFNMRKMIDAEFAIVEKILKNQFVKLILKSLSKMKQTFFQNKEFMIVINALNECERKKNIQTILWLLERTKNIKSVFLRVFVINKSKFFIRFNFKQMSNETYRNLIFHEITRKTIKRNITLFLEHKLAKIKKRRCFDAFWSKKKNIQILINMTMSFFIFVAIVYRFFKEINNSFRKRLNDVFKYNVKEIFNQNVTYFFIINNLFNDHEKREKKKLFLKFRNIVKFIIVLKISFFIISLASLFDVLQKNIRCKLDFFHVVFSIFIDKHLFVRLFHLFFCDFLFNFQKREKSSFWINKNETHQKLITKYLQLICISKKLKQNICTLSSFESFKNEIDKRLLNETFFAEFRYACRYWIYHVRQNNWQICDDELIYEFLQNYVFYWLKAMSFVKKTTKTVKIINILQLFVNVWFFVIFYLFILLIYDINKQESQTHNFFSKYTTIYFMNFVNYKTCIATIIHVDFDLCFWKIHNAKTVSKSFFTMNKQTNQRIKELKFFITNVRKSFELDYSCDFFVEWQVDNVNIE